MKKLAPAVALLLLGGAAFLARGEKSPPPSSPKPLRKSPARVEAAAPADAISLAAPAAETKRVRASSIVLSTAVAGPTWKRIDPNAGLAGFFKSELALSEEQVRGIAGILEDRALAVSSYEAEVHQRGWFRLEDFDHRVGELRGLSYRRIESLLDAEQARKFEALWPVQLLAKDCIVVSLPEEKVVTLD